MLKKRAFRIFIYFAAVLLVIWSLAPIAWMVISSITPSNQMVQSERILPDNFTVDRYKMVLFGQQIEGVNRNAAAQSAVFRRALVNSVILAVMTTVISIAMGASASYAFARLQFRGSKMFQFTALFFQLAPAHCTADSLLCGGQQNGDAGSSVFLDLGQCQLCSGLCDLGHEQLFPLHSAGSGERRPD